MSEISKIPISAEEAEKPWNFRFFSLLRKISAKFNHLPRLGTAQRPSHEPVRIGQKATLTFAPREIAEISLTAIPQIKLFGLGMLGPNGALPLHFTEIVRERCENRRDFTLANFIDLFHHRMLLHFYRAWEGSQAAAGLDRAEEEVFSRYISRLMGDDPDDTKNSVLPTHARLAASTHLVRQSRNAEGLEATLSRFFGVTIKVCEFQLFWIKVNEEDKTKLGFPSISSILGHGALAGDRIADRQHQFRLLIGPLNLQQYLRFTPNGEDIQLLIEWVRAFVGFEFAWEVELMISPISAPPARISGDEKLGWSTWLGQADRSKNVTGLIYEPEKYFINK